MSFRPQRLERARRRGVTLIEVLVVSVIVVIVSGIVFGILLETRRSCMRGQDQLSVQACAQAAADEIVSTLEAALRPDALDDSATSLSLRFEPEVCEVVSSRNYTGQDFYLTVIGNLPPSENAEPQAVSIKKALDSKRMTGVAREETRTLGLADGRFETKVQFDYATQANPQGPEPVFQNRLAPGEYPRLVRIRVTVTDSEGNVKRPYELIATARLL